MKSTHSFKRQRRVWNCIINPEFLQDVATPVFETAIQRLIELWTIKSELAEKSTFVAYEDLRRATLDGIWKLITGIELGLGDVSISRLETKRLQGQYGSVYTGTTPSSSFPHFFNDFIRITTGMDWVVQGISPRIYKWIFNRLPPLLNSMNRTKTMLGGFITETRGRIRTQLPLKRCGLSDVLQQKDNTVSDAALIDEMLELFITGHETTASTAAWGLKYLAEHQEIQQRLYNYLRKAFPNATKSSLPTALDISQTNIPYLDAVLAEILRMAGTGPVLFRETLLDCEIMGHQIRAETPLLLITQSPPGPNMITPDTFKVEQTGPVQQIPGKFQNWNDLFQDFIPERWLDHDGNFDPDAGLSLPFATGKRGCFGKRIAMLELKFLVAMLVFSFRFDRLPKALSKFNSRDGLTRQPACCYVKPVLRHIERVTRE
jgi:cytochrome P450